MGGIVANPDASKTLNASCTAALDGSLLNEKNIYVSVPRSSAIWFLALPPANGRAVTVLASFQPAESAALCASCGSAACLDVSRFVPWMDKSVLQLTVDPSQPFSEFTTILQ
jgi:hypothetical protein